MTKTNEHRLTGNSDGSGPASSAAKALDQETEGNVMKVAAIEEAHKLNRTRGERIADIISTFCGSMLFVYIQVVWFAAWIILNTVSTSTQFDPFPFTFLTLVVSLEAIFLSIFILISQNLETRLTERRNHLDLQINLLAEQENTKMLDLLQQIAKEVGVPADDAQTVALLQPVNPDQIVEQIASATEKAVVEDSGKNSCK